MSSSIKKLIPVALKQPIRHYLDARSRRLQPRLGIRRCLRWERFRTQGIRSAMTDPSIAAGICPATRTGSRACTRSAKSREASIPAIDAPSITLPPGSSRARFWKPAPMSAHRLSISQAPLHHFSGRLTTADIVDVNAPDAPWRSHGLQAAPAAILSRSGLGDTVTFLTRSASEALASRERYDFIFLDGDHSALAVYREVSAALGLLNPGGFILLHDFYPTCGRSRRTET